jgi:hypothetical protein
MLTVGTASRCVAQCHGVLCVCQLPPLSVSRLGVHTSVRRRHTSRCAGVPEWSPTGVKFRVGRLAQCVGFIAPLVGARAPALSVAVVADSTVRRGACNCRGALCAVSLADTAVAVDMVAPGS